MRLVCDNAIKLFPGTAPGSEGFTLEEEFFYEETEDGKVKHIVQNVLEPELIPFFPEHSTENENAMPAVMIIPGGAFRRLVYNFEGEEIARWLNTLGFAAFVLKCRLPVNEHPSAADVSLIDVQRGLRLIRHNAAEWGIDSKKIGVMGFSAGGFFSALLATAYDKKVYQRIDAADDVSARPDFCVCGYPMINYDVSVEAGQRYISKEEIIAGIYSFQELVLKKYKPDELVTPQTPPVFIFETDDDMTTLAENSVCFYMAARKAGVSSELHIFRTGGHGFGLGDDNTQTGEWKKLFVNWATGLGVLL